MKPQRPYLLRALYEWLVDSEEVPYVLVDATQDGVKVPQEYVEDGQIVLDIGPNAVRNLALEDEFVMCSSRFAGRVFELVLPMSAIRAIYGRDSGQGMVFPEEDPFKEAGQEARQESAQDGTEAASQEGAEDQGTSDSETKPNLRLV